MTLRGLLLFISLVLVAHGQAVSSLNSKLGFSYGQLDNNEGKTVNGSVAFPVTTHFGAQVDGLYTNVSHRDFYGAGTHFFWRDPDKALVGLAAGGVHTNVVETYEGGLEAEYYWRWLTVGTYTGVSTIQYSTPTPFISTDKTMGFATVYLGFYPLPDLLIRPSYNVKLGNTYYGLEAEYALPVHNLTVTADLAKGDHDYDHAMFGLRYYFGGKKSLKSRHRQDDPVNVTANALTAIGTYGAEYNQKAASYAQNIPYTGGDSYGASANSIVGDGWYHVGGISRAGGGSNTYTGGTTTSGGTLNLGGGTITGTFNTGMTGTLNITGNPHTFVIGGNSYLVAPGSYHVQVANGVYQFIPVTLGSAL